MKTHHDPKSAAQSTEQLYRHRFRLARRMPGGRLAAAGAVLFLLWSEAFSATFRYASSSDRIYVEGGGSATLSDIKAALPNAPLDLVDPGNKIWLLRANLLIADGSVLMLHGSSAGGDVNEFRLQSNNSSASNSFVSVTADYGGIDINSTKVTSWDLAAGGPDTEFQTYGRAFIRARSSLADDGVTALESRMDIVNSDIGYLGYDAAESYGLTWKVNGVSPDPSKTIFDLVDVFGDIHNSRIHHNYFGVYTFGALGCQWTDNEVDHNAGYGIDPHDDSDNLLIEGNNVHENGFQGRGHHGIIASRRCDHVVIRNNRSWGNAGNGIMLHRHSNDGLVENNDSFNNGDAGIAIFDADRAVIRNNLVISNLNAGMRFSVGAADNVVDHNEVGYSGRYGFYLYQGSDIPEPDDGDPSVTGRPQRNQFSNNLVHHTAAQAVNLGDADDTTFSYNTFTPGPNALEFENSANNVLISNSFPADVLVRLDGNPTNATTMSLQGQPLVQLQIDAYSTARFQSLSGAIFDLDQANLATTAEPSGSTLTVTLAALGAQSATAAVTVFTRDFLTVPDAGAILVDPTLWETSGALRKQWTVQPTDGPSPQAVSITATVHYKVGNLSPNSSYMVLKNGQRLTSVNSDSTGHVSFSDAPGTSSAVQYEVAVNTQPTLPTVTVVASDAAASESGPDRGTFTITRSGSTAAALTVNYSLGGSASNGTDYQSLSGSATIAAGAASASVIVIPIDDTAVEGNETVVLTLSANAAYTVGSPKSATVTIADNDQAAEKPIVSLATPDSTASESGPDTATITIRRTGSTAAALTVQYSLGGSASNGTDYQSLSGSATIPAGAAATSVTITPIDDTAVEGDETVVLTLSANTAYTVGSPSSATVTITDNDQVSGDKPVVSLSTPDAVASESGPDPATVKVYRTGSTAAALTVTYQLGGTAENGADYETLSGSVTLPVGSSSANIVVRPINDSQVELIEWVTFTVRPNNAYIVGSPSTASIMILDNDLLLLGTEPAIKPQ